MNVLILTECSLSRRHGTGAQVLRMFEDRLKNGSDFSLYLTKDYAGMSEVDRSQCLGEPRWPWRGRQPATLLERALSISWWRRDGSLRKARLLKLLRRSQFKPDVIYVVAAGEEFAGRFSSIIDLFQVPVLIHAMDLYHNSLDPASTPAFSSLIRKTSARLAISRAIAVQLNNIGMEPPAELILIGQRDTSHRASPPIDSSNIKVLTVGRPYHGGVQLLSAAAPSLRDTGCNIKIVYVGQHQQMFPASISSYVEDRGYISDPNVYERLVAECQIAYLSGPDELDHFGLYSLPSRISDFLMAGLPVVACVAAGSATEQILQPLVRSGGAAIVQSIDELSKALLGFTESTSAWNAASRAALEFAHEFLHIDKIRGRVLSRLEDLFAETPKTRAFGYPTAGARLDEMTSR